MKKTINLFLLAVCAIFLASCSEDDLSIAVTGMSESAGYPYQDVKILFDNPDFRKFEVFFDDKPSPLNTQANLSGSADGMRAQVPSFSEEKDVVVTVKAEGKTFTVPGTFKVKAHPTITYVSGTHTGFRVPFKIVVKNKDYFNEGEPYVDLCQGADCYSAFTEIQGDTVIVTSNETYSESFANPRTIKVYGWSPTGVDPDKALEFIQGTQQIYLHPTYAFAGSYTAAPGSTVGVVLDNGSAHPEDIIVRLGSVALEYIGWDIVGGTGYLNALYGGYKIPDDLPPGVYEITVEDIDGVEYLAEKQTTFTVE